MTKPLIDLGLGDLAGFDPAARPPRPVQSAAEAAAETAAIDAVGRDHGFTKNANSPPLPRRSRRAAGEPLHQINIRGPISVMAQFVAFADAERLSYWEALAELMGRPPR